MAKVILSCCALLCLLLTLTSMGEARAVKPPRPSTDKGCCSEYVKHKLPVDRMVSYTVDRAGRCRLDAVKFTMVSGKVFCTNPAEKWVQDAMDIVKNGKSAAKTA